MKTKKQIEKRLEELEEILAKFQPEEAEYYDLLDEYKKRFKKDWSY